MDLELPITAFAETIQRARPAVTALKALRDEGALPGDLPEAALDALLTVMDAVMAASADDNADFNPSEAAQRLRVARPSVMRLIARGELSARKDGGHYLLAAREIRSFQTRLTSVRREALSELHAMGAEFGF